jgi:hypothetical protein
MVLYDTGGIIKNIDAKKVSYQGDDNLKDITLNIDASSAQVGSYIKVFVWDSQNLSPLCDINGLDW